MATLSEARGGKFSFRIRSSCQSIMGLILLLCGDTETCPEPVPERRYNHDLEHLTNQRGLKILQQNVLGLFANHAYICELIQSFKGIDILTLSETYVESNDTDSGGSRRKSGRGSTLQFWAWWVWLAWKLDLCDDVVK